jgi:hypothetical protein
MKEPQALITLKEYAIFAPAIGGGLAIVFDVGYFYGLNSGFFASFSLSEHLVFSLGAIPIAVFFMALGALGWMMFTSVNQRAGYLKGLFIGLMLFCAILSGIEFWYQEGFIAMSLATIIAAFVPLYFLESRHRPQFALVFSTPILGLCISFMSGILLAQSQLNYASQRSKIELEGGQSIEGRFIRSGERGALIYQPGNKVFYLVPWTKIVNVQNDFGN